MTQLSHGTVLKKHRVVFLLGAGSSKPAGVPTTFEFVSEFKRAGMPSDLVPAFSALIAQLEPWQKRTGRALDIELLYEVLLRLDAGDDDFFVSAFDASELGLTPESCRRLRTSLEEYIKTRAFVAVGAVGYLLPLRSFVPADAPLTIFTTNYDTAIELVCESLRLRWQDGFALTWAKEVFEQPGLEVALRKIHGSVLWYVDDRGMYFRSPIRSTRSPPEGLQTFAGGCRPLLIYPARKSAHEEPYADNLSALRSTLSEPDSPVFLVVVGYSFRDDHLRQLVADALARNRALRVVLVDPAAERIHRERLLRSTSSTGDINRAIDAHVFRINAPISEELLSELRHRLLPAYEGAVEDEQRLRQQKPEAASVRELARRFRTFGDFGAFYRCGRAIEYRALDSLHDPEPLLYELLPEIVELAASGTRPPAERRLEKSVSELAVLLPGRVRVLLVAGGESQVRWVGVENDRVTAAVRKECGRARELAALVDSEDPRKQPLERLIGLLSNLEAWLEAYVPRNQQTGEARELSKCGNPEKRAHAKAIDGMRDMLKSFSELAELLTNPSRPCLGCE